MDDDNKEFSLNLAADLMGNMLQDRVELNKGVYRDGRRRIKAVFSHWRISM